MFENQTFALLILQRDVRYSARNSAKSPFLKHNISKCRVDNGTETNGLNLALQLRGIVEQGLEHSCIVLPQVVVISLLNRSRKVSH